jgi:hypothetical protein
VIIVRLSRWSEAERSPANIKSPPLRGGIVRAVRIASPPRDQYILSAAVRSVQATNDFEAIGITTIRCRLAAGGEWIRTISSARADTCPHVDFSVEAAELVDLVGDWALTFAAAACDLV